jgi:nitrate reductase / nitrite oxidoreductase, alpha subunit
MRAFGEQLCVYKPPVDLKTIDAHPRQALQRQQGDRAELHHPAPEVGHPQHLHRQPADADPVARRADHLDERGGRRQGRHRDNDWIEAFNINGAITARAVVSQRVPEGMSMMYHAQEKIVNTPGSEITGMRGGIHNSVTRAVLKPTHMIGGYAQQSYFFNYSRHGGRNRDEFIIVRKMNKVDWMDGSEVTDAMRVEDCLT